MARKKVIGTCRLCLTENIELINSHVFPRYLWEPLFDDRRKFLVASFDPPKVKENSDPKMQNGFKEYLLCKNCDGNIIGKYDTYAKRKLDEKFMVLNQLGEHLIEGLDYKQFKLFLLSILWRCSITSNLSFALNLGPHQENLRQILYNEITPPCEKYGCAAMGVIGDSGLAIQQIYNAFETRLDGHRCYRILFAGFIWLFFVSNHAPSSRFNKIFLQETGTMSVFNLPLEQITFLMKSAEALYQAGLFTDS